MSSYVVLKLVIVLVGDRLRFVGDTDLESVVINEFCGITVVLALVETLASVGTIDVD